MSTTATAAEVFPERFEMALAARGVKLGWLAERVGVNRNLVAGHRKGRHEPGAFKVAAYARILRVSADWLLGLSDEGGPDEC